MVHHILEIQPTGEDKEYFQENEFPRNAVNILVYWIVKLSRVVSSYGYGIAQKMSTLPSWAKIYINSEKNCE